MSILTFVSGHHTVRFLTTVVFEKLKQEARRRKNNTPTLTHRRALDIVAVEAGFSRWQEVVEARERMIPVESALREGLVVAYDVKDAGDIEEGQELINELVLPSMCTGKVTADLRAYDPEEPLEPSDIEEYTESLVFYRAAPSSALDDEMSILFFLERICFHPPRHVWWKGVPFDLYGSQ